jgi:hypothetical protein
MGFEEDANFEANIFRGPSWLEAQGDPALRGTETGKPPLGACSVGKTLFRPAVLVVKLRPISRTVPSMAW